MNILVTAFDPFGGEKSNPALEAVKQLEDHIGEHTITKLEIPTVFHESKESVDKELAKGGYDAVLAIGQAGGRYDLTPERVGINIDDARIADNKGNQPIDVPIQEDGAPAYFSNLPVKKMTEAIKQAGVPASLSNTAGTFVCNHILYQLGYLADKSYPGLLFGFIHVPFIPEQVTDKPEKPSMSIDTIAKGLTAAIKAISRDEDAKIALGETH
ncbi:pyroglutamyl-peptidase I [Staphylococcus croceilyticus]|uniref:Pyrrolidone-carboxylate peptidase n=1 Tax=Staphylococcus croceilyticus TaxID=319942 RepID=A0ABY2KG37_9STAP|nr:pyroglutamyl-peptidase I [Staphylococcus croceilyticus]PNZ69503.1 pyroglutamyl-peptidase I [Staphylococcus croceilyticus]TGA81031.1 pyroglutamyl-peptidase I [Staphylococcus croceilyticus]